jgi:two-component system, NtrC family, response regulator AtoC
MSDSDLAGLAVLVVEDETLLRRQIASRLERLGADVTGSGTLEAARNVLRDLDFDLVLLDVNLPDGRGLDLFSAPSFPANTGVIVMTADGGVKGAVEAVRLGALDYLVKPFDVEELPLVIGRVRKARQSARLEEHRRNDPARSGDDFFFGQTLAGFRNQLEKILAADERMRTRLPPVLIEGETGTGKTTIARWLHHHGPRAGLPLVEMNCSALPETLAESELFGHEKGAFTDARSGRMGLFEAAHGGTLFLDELPSLSLGLQAKVLKAVEDQRIRRLGGNKEIPVDVRVIAATNHNLRALVESGAFREDLFHRLDLYRLRLPPLRERREDIAELAQILVQRLCRRHRLPAKTLTAEGRRRLLGQAWPGNVRELSHEIERAIVFEEGSHLNFEPLQRGPAGSAATAGQPEDWLNPNFMFPSEGFQLEEAVHRLIQQALKQTGQNVSAAARLLGVSRDYLRYRLDGTKSGPPHGE